VTKSVWLNYNLNLALLGTTSASSGAIQSVVISRMVWSPEVHAISGAFTIVARSRLKQRLNACDTSITCRSQDRATTSLDTTSTGHGAITEVSPRGVLTVNWAVIDGALLRNFERRAFSTIVRRIFNNSTMLRSDWWGRTLRNATRAGEVPFAPRSNLARDGAGFGVADLIFKQIATGRSIVLGAQNDVTSAQLLTTTTS
jgi:hypothetical protein